MRRLWVIICAIGIANVAFGQTGDFNDDGVYNCVDVSLLVAAIRDGSDDPRFTDFTVYDWLQEAESALGYEVRRGDFDLDGAVDHSDGNVIATRLYLEGDGWCDGDLDGNGIVDLNDENIVGLNWQHGATTPRMDAAYTVRDASQATAWNGGAIFAESETIQLISVPQRAPDGLLATILVAQMRDPSKRFTAIDRLAIRGDLHQAWLDGPFGGPTALGVPQAGRAYHAEWIPYDSHLLIEFDHIMNGFGGSYSGISDFNDETDPTNSAAKLPALEDGTFPVKLGIGDVVMASPTDFFSLQHDRKSDFVEIAYLVTPAVMPETGTPGNVSLTIGLLGADSNTPLPSEGVAGLNEPIPIPFFFPLCDFDIDGDCDLVDIDALVGAIAANDTQFDLNGDEFVDVNDIDTWLDVASRDGRVLVRGDANLDGKVDARDLNELAKNWLTPGDYGWSGGDFNGNGIAGSEDLNAIGLNWQRGVPFDASVVPEPKVPTLIWALVFLAIRGCARGAALSGGNSCGIGTKTVS